jgi:DNA-directed RNA polymerase
MYELAIEQLKFRAEKFKQQGLDDGHHLHNRSIQSWMWTWHNLLQARLKDEIATVQVDGAKNADDAEVILHLTRVSPEKLSLLTILEIMRLSGTGGVVSGMKTARALIAVGKAVEGEYKSQVCREHGLPYNEMRTKSGDFFSNLGYKHLHQRRVAAAQTMLDNEKWTSPLPQAVRSRVGGLLVHCLMEVANITRVMTSRETGQVMYVSFFRSFPFMPFISFHSADPSRNQPFSTHTSIYAARNSVLSNSTLLFPRSWQRIAWNVRSTLATFLCSSSLDLGSITRREVICITNVCSSFSF